MHSLNMLWSAHNEEAFSKRRQRNEYRRSVDKIYEMSNHVFIQRFRLVKPTFVALVHELRIETSIKGSKEIPLEVKVLCALSFLATGSYQRLVGICSHLPQRTTSRCINQVVDALNHPKIRAKGIVFPTTRQERGCIKQEFQRKFGLPGVIGCIDCTHMALMKPKKEEHLFYNRKGYHSLNVQMMCCNNLYIRNVNTKFDGGTHDAHIWSSSKANPYMHNLHKNNEQVWLLGDSGYLESGSSAKVVAGPWLMTPILNAIPGSREHLYTTRHVQARNCIERCFGLLKARWRCLLKDRVLHYHPHVVSKITVACCVLQNIAIKAGLPSPEPVITYDEEDDATLPNSISTATESQNEVVQGRAMLSCLLNKL